MDRNYINLQPCTNCGFNSYELIDGHYYCVECNEQCQNKVAVEHDEYVHDTKKVELKVKGKEKKQSLEGSRLYYQLDL